MTEPITTETTTVDTTEVLEEPQSDVVEPTTTETEDEPETFPRSYVEELRQESGRYRQRAQQGDVYGQRLHTELVRATGRLADPTDLPFDAGHLHDGDSMSLAIDELLTRKPHLASRRPVGDIGQGASSSSTESVDLAELLRQRAL
ncbi:hypothetical protein BH11ACT7_BH11ACT7_20560 [soil metagenome]